MKPTRSMICARCNCENVHDAIYCDQCGAGLEIVCRECGSGNRPTAQFCRRCGRRIDDP